MALRSHSEEGGSFGVVRADGRASEALEEQLHLDASVHGYSSMTAAVLVGEASSLL